jgi:phosphatidylinositol alpha-1,6-mannosyltransferase
VGADPLRIIWFAQDFPPEMGGTQVYNLEYATRLAELGHELRVFTWKGDGPAGEIPDLPFEVHRESRVRGRRGIQPVGVRAALTRWRPEVALASGGCRTLSGVAHFVGRRVPLVLSLHDVRDKGRARGRLRRWWVRRGYGFEIAAGLVANSAHTRERLLRLGVPAEKVTIVHPGVDTTRFVPDPEAGRSLRRQVGIEGRRVLLTVARLAANKGHARVIEALPKLRAEIPDLVYTVVGSGPMREELERVASERGVAELVHFAGTVPDVRAWYNACDVFVMPSTQTGRGLKAAEGFGMAYLEAGACAKPVIASTSGGGAEIVDDGVTGRLVAPGDEAGLAAALRELLTRPEQARVFGEKAREHVLGFDWSQGVIELEWILRQAASIRSGS